jgi:hypothetical protein
MDVLILMQVRELLVRLIREQEPAPAATGLDRLVGARLVALAAIAAAR